MRLLPTELRSNIVVFWSVSVGYDRNPYKNGWTDLSVVWDVDSSVGSRNKKPCIRRKPPGDTGRCRDMPGVDILKLTHTEAALTDAASSPPLPWPLVVHYLYRNLNGHSWFLCINNELVCGVMGSLATPCSLCASLSLCSVQVNKIVQDREWESCGANDSQWTTSVSCHRRQLCDIWAS